MPVGEVWAYANVHTGRFDPEFIEDRRKKLESFLVSVANHNYFRFIPALHDFLQNTNANVSIEDPSMY